MSQSTALPERMTAIVITRPGPPGVLKPETRPMPTVGKGDVLIRVAAAGINRADCGQRAGSYPPPPGTTDLPGLEVAGIVVAVGNDVDAWHVGDAVCALANGGGYAEYAAIPAGQCLPVPKGLDWREAAALPETCFTVWTNVFQRGRLANGETLLVHGGSSGIGTTAIPLARAFGARVFATAGSAEKVAVCEKLGAERGINYREEDFVAIVKSMTDGNGVDVILDMVGGDYAPRNIDALAMDGRTVMIALPRGRMAELDLGKIIGRRLTVTGSGLRPMTTAAKAGIADAAEAHRLMEEGSHIGKIVLDVDLSLPLD